VLPHLPPPTLVLLPNSVTAMVNTNTPVRYLEGWHTILYAVTGMHVYRKTLSQRLAAYDSRAGPYLDGAMGGAGLAVQADATSISVLRHMSWKDSGWDGLHTADRRRAARFHTLMASWTCTVLGGWFRTGTLVGPMYRRYRFSEGFAYGYAGQKAEEDVHSVPTCLHTGRAWRPPTGPPHLPTHPGW